MGELAVQAIKSAFRFAMVAIIIAAAAILFLLVTTAIAGFTAGSVVGELSNMIQIWLPFNLGQSMVSIGSIVLAYQAYKLARWFYERSVTAIGRN
ncbi:hypothetical protein FWH58_02105 [Candidatus Saccharibacteria bacterium]|nr:hypothetical protein [Candidatus Saccharibacteria bacterium]